MPYINVPLLESLGLSIPETEELVAMVPVIKGAGLT